MRCDTFSVLEGIFADSRMDISNSGTFSSSTCSIKFFFGKLVLFGQ